MRTVASGSTIEIDTLKPNQVNMDVHDVHMECTIPGLEKCHCPRLGFGTLHSGLDHFVDVMLPDRFGDERRSYMVRFSRLRGMVSNFATAAASQSRSGVILPHHLGYYCPTAVSCSRGARHAVMAHDIGETVHVPLREALLSLLAQVLLYNTTYELS